MQERASTLRHILSDFGILPLDWETTVKKGGAEEPVEMPSTETIIEESKKSSSYLLDLLDPSAEIMHSVAVTKPIDDGGARQAKAKAKILFAAIAEPFYAVHSKAQRKVPVPEGLSVTAPIKESALSKLLQVEIPDNLTVSNLYFIPTMSMPGSFVGSDPGYNGASNEDDRSMNAAVSDIFKNSIFPTFGSNDNSSLPFPKPTMTGFGPGSGIPSSNAMPPPRNPEDSLFYLSSNNAKGEAAPSLSQILADTFEEKKHSKRSKKDKSYKSSKVELDRREMLPAGALSSDEENTYKKGKSRKSKSSSDAPITRRKGKDEVSNR